ncbi:MAG: acyl-CoA thioesterase [Leptospiraceae bacterium]|nr:acyl-CoA thioesterase [Leptospiraceae bacterium]
MKSLDQQKWKNPETYTYQQQIKTTWGDMDAFGHINNVTFARYFESVRADYFSTVGLWENDGRSVSSGMVIVNLNMDYRQQAVYPQVLDAWLCTAHIGTKSFRMEFLMQNENAAPVVTASAAFVWFDFGQQKAVRVPEAFRDKVRLYEKKFDLQS